MNHNKRFKNRLINLLTAFLIMLSISCALFGVVSGFKEEAVVVKADDKQTYTISSIADLIDYINDHRDEHKNPKDTLIFSNMRTIFAFFIFSNYTFWFKFFFAFIFF